MDDYMSAVLDLVVLRTLHLAGFRKIASRTLQDGLNDVLTSYIALLAERSSGVAVHAGRTIVHARDVLTAYEELPTNGSGGRAGLKEWVEGDEAAVIRKAVKANSRQHATGLGSSTAHSADDLARLVESALYGGKHDGKENWQRIEWADGAFLQAEVPDEDLMADDEKGSLVKEEDSEKTFPASPVSSEDVLMTGKLDHSDIPPYLPHLPDSRMSTQDSAKPSITAAEEPRSNFTIPIETERRPREAESITEAPPPTRTSMPSLVSTLAALQSSQEQRHSTPLNPERQKLAMVYLGPELALQQSIPRSSMYQADPTDALLDLARRIAPPLLLAKLTQSEPVTVAYDSKKKYDQPLSSLMTTPAPLPLPSPSYFGVHDNRARSNSLSSFRLPARSHSPAATPSTAALTAAASPDVGRAPSAESQPMAAGTQANVPRPRLHIRLGSHSAAPASRPVKQEPMSPLISPSAARRPIKRIRILTAPG